MLSGIKYDAIERLDHKSIIAWADAEGYEVIDNGVVFQDSNTSGVLYTWCVTNDQGQRLYGFKTKSALSLARLIEAKCDGIGPAVASLMCQTLDHAVLADLIAKKNVKGITSQISGVGTKKAETLCTKLSPEDVKAFLGENAAIAAVYKKVVASATFICGQLNTAEGQRVAKLVTDKPEIGTAKLTTLAVELVQKLRNASSDG